MSSYPKLGKSGTTRTARPRKRRFYGKRNESEEDEGASTSARKLASASFEEISTRLTHFYRIIEFVSVFGVLSEFIICKDCKKKITFEETSHKGLGFAIVAICECSRRDIASGPHIHNGYEINRRIVFVMRLLGVGRDGINLFCGLMDIGKGLSKNTYDLIVEHVHSASKSVFDFLCKKAVDEEKRENEKNKFPLLNLKVSGDGSWKKRGFNSLFGVTSLIGNATGKVIDAVVKSSYCKACLNWKDTNSDEYKLWYEEHEPHCTNNHTGSAGKMEVDAVKEMFSSSEEKYGVRYSHYIGDGDAKTFKALLDSKPYGDDFVVKKCECVGHVQKRMGTRLRNVKKEQKIGGKGKLTDSVIKELTNYYGLAIRRNSNSVEDMEREIMATYYHKISTNDNPRHEFCPKGADSWCKYNSAQALRTSFDHPAPLHSDVAKHILPLYTDLSRKDLLERCLGGYTQNSNESFNSAVWKLCPKHLHSGTKIVETAVYIAVAQFNEGYSGILRILKDLDIIIGVQCRSFAEEMDDKRTKRQDSRHRSCSRKSRAARKQQAVQQSELLEEAEGVLYGPGIAD